MSALKKKLKELQQEDLYYESNDLLGTGSTLLNLSFSGDPFGGIPKGSYVLLVGEGD
mgnify:CR=1 FL=1